MSSDYAILGPLGGATGRKQVAHWMTRRVQALLLTALLLEITLEEEETFTADVYAFRPGEKALNLILKFVTK